MGRPLILLLALGLGLDVFSLSANAAEAIKTINPYNFSAEYRLSLDYADGAFAAADKRSPSQNIELEFFDGILEYTPDPDFSFHIKYDLVRRAFYWAYVETYLANARIRAGVNLTLEGGYDNERLAYDSLITSPYTLESSPLGGVAPMLEMAWPDFIMGGVTLQLVRDVAATPGRQRGYYVTNATQPAAIGRWDFTLGRVRPSFTIGTYDTNQSNFKVFSLAYTLAAWEVFYDYVYDARSIVIETNEDRRAVTYYSSRSLEVNWRYDEDWRLKAKYISYAATSDAIDISSNPPTNGQNTSFDSNLAGWAMGVFFQEQQPIGGFVAYSYRSGVFRGDALLTDAEKERQTEKRLLIGVIGKF